MTAPMQKTRIPGIFRRGARYVVVYRDAAGRQRKAAAHTLAEARDLQARIKADLSRGEYRDPTCITFAEYATQWVETYQGRTSRGFREATRADYRSALTRHAIPFFGSKRLSELAPRDIKALATRIAQTGVAPRTVRLALAPVSACLATAVEEGVLRANPATGVRVAQPARNEDQPARRKALTPVEVRRFLEVVDPEWRLFFEVLATTGMRVSEALALRWGDLDLERQTVQVRRAFVRGEVVAPKSRYGRREIPLIPQVAHGLARRYADVGGPDDGELLFSRLDGTPCSQSALRRAVLEPARTAAGVDWAGFHAFRHACASMLFAHGWNAAQVQRVLGHHSPAFTLATYVHVADDALPAPVFLGDLLQGGNRVATSQAETGRNQARTPTSEYVD